MNRKQTNFISNELSLRGIPIFHRDDVAISSLPKRSFKREEIASSPAKGGLLAMTINGIMNMNLLSFTSKDDYIQKDLRRRFDDARDITEVIDIIELTRYFQFNTLAQQMIADLHEEERRMWRRHVMREE